jgi:hypothetical protein
VEPAESKEQVLARLSERFGLGTLDDEESFRLPGGQVCSVGKLLSGDEINRAIPPSQVPDGWTVVHRDLMLSPSKRVGLSVLVNGMPRWSYRFRRAGAKRVVASALDWK